MHLRNLALFLALAAPLPALADSYVYTYTGDDFTSASGNVTTSDFVTITLTLDAPLADNLVLSTISPSVWSTSDGAETIGSSTPGSDESSFRFTTDAAGSIADWIIFGDLSNGDYINSFGPISGASDTVYSQLGNGDSVTSGTWTTEDIPATAATPEGPSIAYLALGAACAAGLTLVRRGYGQPLM